jgi:hypothetical protein
MIKNTYKEIRYLGITFKSVFKILLLKILLNYLSYLALNNAIIESLFLVLWRVILKNVNNY